MFGIEIMTGAALFALINLLLALVAMGLVYFIWKDINAGKKPKGKIALVGVLILAAVFFSSVTQPKVSIQTLPNMEQQQYDDAKEVVIEPVEERTKKLDGFKPLGE